MDSDPLMAVYAGEPFKLTAIDCTGRRIIIGWTRLPEAAALVGGRKVADRDGLTDVKYQPVKNRKTGDDPTTATGPSAWRGRGR